MLKLLNAHVFTSLLDDKLLENKEDLGFIVEIPCRFARVLNVVGTQ